LASARRPPPSARDCGRHTAAHGASRHHLHQHHHRKNQRHAGERIGAELADKISLDQSHRGVRQHYQDIGGSEPDQRRRDRAFDQRARARVVTRRFGRDGLVLARWRLRLGHHRCTTSR
jgi:hypothetical protein